MSDRSFLTSVVDCVWLVGQDGQWHSRNELAKHLPFRLEHVAAAVDFLVKYGFAQFSSQHGRRFRLIRESPPPRDIAQLLRHFELARTKTNA